jgi:thioredoxin reductase
MPYDVIIIGGSFAGLAAALQLGRASRLTLVIDAGEPRNRFASHAHGLLGQDGVPPQAILDNARAQLARYSAISIHHDTATSARPTDSGFTVTTARGEVHTARRLILATGVTDELPDIPGLRERWGQSVIHCPYCHGYEVRNQRLGVLAISPLTVHLAELVRDWSADVTLFKAGEFELDMDLAEALARRGVQVESRPVTRLTGTAPDLDGVILTDGAMVPLDALFVASRATPAGPFVAQLGVETNETPLGWMIHTEGLAQTSVPGVFAAGDIAKMPPSLSVAIADGAMAGIAVHRSLVFEPELLSAA